MISNNEIRKQLEAMSEVGFQRFSSSLIPNIQSESVIGVRLPILRKMAQKIAKGDWKTYLHQASSDSFEETMLQGMVIGYVKEQPEEIFSYIDTFLPKIDNWSVCDSFCCGLKITKQYPQEMWNYLLPYFHSDKEYSVRFAVVMLLFYYVEKPYVEDALHMLQQISYDAYYVKMAVAWAVSIYYVTFPKEVTKFLQQGALDDFTYNKALQKICESRQVDIETKKSIRQMKR